MKSSFCLALVIVLAGSVSPVKAAQSAPETGARLLQAQLPAGTTISQADCEQLARAVGRATLAHRADAPAILSAALKTKRPCACVTRIFRVAVAAAPTRASALLETASALCPDCADALAAALNAADDKNTVADDKNVVDDKNGPAKGRSADGPLVTRDFGNSYANDPATADLSDRDFGGLGFGDGFGPGFPGSPGFIGSPASGGLALPSPIAETPVVNG